MPNSTPNVKCARCGSGDVRISRQTMPFLGWLYCLIFNRERYRCARCNDRFFARRGLNRRRERVDEGEAVGRPAGRNGMA